MAGNTEYAKAWHRSDKFHLAVEEFHNKYKLSPEKAQGDFERITENIIKELDICDEYKGAGSSYEGVKIANKEADDDFEFDVMMILNVSAQTLFEMKVIRNRPGYFNACLKNKNWSANEPSTVGNAFIKACLGTIDDVDGDQDLIFDAGKASNKFLGMLQQWINKNYFPEFSFVLRSHGPAIQLDVRKKINEKLFFSVDITPTIEFDSQDEINMVEKPSMQKTGNEKIRYVAKPEKKRTPDSITWFKMLSDVNEPSPYCSEIQSKNTYRQFPDTLMLLLKPELREASYEILDNLYKAEGKINRKVVINRNFQKELKATPVPERPDSPDYAWLMPRDGLQSIPDSLSKSLTESYSQKTQNAKLLDINKQSNDLEDLLRKCFNSSSLLREKIAMPIRRFGPIVSLFAHPEDKAPNVFDRIDLIPAVQVGQDIYISIHEDFDKLPDTQAWRRSYASEEAERIRRSPENLKKVYRILKAMRNNEPGLAQLTSYHLKNLLLSLEKELNWKDETPAILLIRVLSELRRCLELNSLPAKFLPEIDLLENMLPACIFHMKKRTIALLEKEMQMLSALDAWKNEEGIKKEINMKDIDIPCVERASEFEGRGDKVRLAIDHSIFGFDYRNLVTKRLVEDINVVLFSEDEFYNYDVMLIKDSDKNNVVAEKIHAEDTYCLKYRGAEYIGGREIVDGIKQQLQKRIATCKETVKYDLTLRTEGFQIVLTGSCGLYLNIMPAYQVCENFFMPKAGSVCSWKLVSFDPLKNKVWKAFNIRDCGRKVLNVLESLRRSQPAMSLLTTSHLRSVVFWEMEEQSDWSEAKAAQRLMDVLERISEFLAERKFPDYFRPKQCNLLNGFMRSSIQLTQTAVESLCHNEGEQLLAQLRRSAVPVHY